ncbi:MAG: tetratricopeptide repeat protein [Crocinitomicaceae bacterium]|nr:tetratricopeptide repeat protein [Crocinitomicaceae bacterium]
MRILLISLLYFLPFSSSSCLNLYGYNLQGDWVEADMFSTPFRRSFDEEYCHAYLNKYDLNKKEAYSFEEMSDYAVHLAHLGDYEQSLDLLRWIYNQHPDEYEVVSNLGTLYELNGMNDSAYYFIKKSMEINPDAHYRTEWFHLKVLEAKKHIHDDPNWLNKHNVLGLKLDYAVEENSEMYWNISDTIMQIQHQLVERVPFTPTPDLILANIFKELADMMAVNFSVEFALYYYQISNHYDPDNQFGALEKIVEMEGVISDEDKHSKFETYFPPESEKIYEGNIKYLVDEEIEDPNAGGYTLKTSRGRNGRIGPFQIGLIVIFLSAFITLIVVFLRMRRRKM